MKSSIGRVLVGLVLIAVAVFALLGSLGIGFTMPAGIEVWQWIVGAILFLALIDGLRRLDFVSVMLMLGFEVMVFEPQLGILFGFEETNWISNWLVFFVSLLVGIGLSMIFKGFSFMTVKVKKNTLGSTVKYIDCTEFKKEKVENRLGALVVRFENVCELSRDVTLEVNNSLGETEVYIPSEWNVKVNMVNVLGDIKIDESFGDVRPNEPTMTVKAYNKLGEVNIRAM